MSTVKGSKQHKKIVVTHRPILLWWLGGACAMVLGVVFGLGYFAGSADFSGTDGGATALETALASGSIDAAQAKAIARDPEQVATLLRENAELQQKLVSLEQGGEVDEQALASVQETLVSQRETIAQLQEDLLFYKQIAAPESAEAEQGLVIGQLDLAATKEPRRLRYKIEFRQQGGTDKLDGHASVNVLGDQDGQRVALPLSSLSTQEQDLDIPLSFRYFQNIEGELELPEGFTPERVQVLAMIAGDSAKHVEKSFSWIVRN